MDGMQFIIELIDKLIWPLVFVFVLLNFKQPFTHLIPLAKKLKFKALELEFDQELRQVSKKATDAFPELEQDKKANLIALAQNMPSSAILSAWRRVDEVTETLILSSTQVTDLSSPTRYKLMEDILINTNIIDTQKGKLFNELRTLRNRVAHAEGFQVGQGEAILYVELCFTLIEHLEELIAKASSSEISKVS